MLEKRKVKFKCAKCGRANIIPVEEVSFRTDDDKRVLCTTCCKQKRWESQVCKGCSDRNICSGEFADKMRKFMEGIGGV